MLAAGLLTLSGALADGGATAPTLDGVALACRLLENPDPVEQANFGNAVVILDIDGDGRRDIAVGAPAKKVQHLPGRVWVFLGPNFDQALELESPDSAPGDAFGLALAVANVDDDPADELVVGAPRAAVSGTSGAGRVYLYDWDRGRPRARRRWQADDVTAAAGLGTSLVVGDFLESPGMEIAASAPRGVTGAFSAGRVSFFSARLESSVGASNGRAVRRPRALGPLAFALLAGQGAPAAPAAGTLANPKATSDLGNFGHQLRAADWNGDGRDDLVVSAIFNDVEHAGTVYAYAGQVLVYPGPIAASGALPGVVLDNPLPWIDPQGVPGQPTPPCAFQRFGMWIDARDLDGDGRAEVGVGANRIDALNGVCEAGRGFLFSPDPNQPGGVRELAFEHPLPPADQDLMGWRVAFGDFVGDGTTDFAVAALSANKPHAVFLHDGLGLVGASGLAGPATATLRPAVGHGPHFAEGLAVGDLDGLGRDDLVFGEFDYSSPAHFFVGRVVVTHLP